MNEPELHRVEKPQSFKGTARTLVTVVLTLGLIFNLLLLGSRLSGLHLPGTHTGFEPEQPIAFSHRLHAGEMQISCFYCHPGAQQERWAGTPASDICYNCHRFVQATLGAVREEEKRASEEKRKPAAVLSEEIAKIYASLGINTDREPVAPAEPIHWIRIHDLPDYVVFHHGAHTRAGVDCGQCHGEAERMEKIRQVESLSMGWCVNCHRDYRGRIFRGRTLDPSIDCMVCHH